MTTVRQHPDFASGKRQVNVVAILPADAEYRHLVFTGENERDAAREQSIATDIEANMASILGNHGFTPKTDLLEKARAGDKELNFQLEQLKGAYVQVEKELYAQTMVQEEESTRFKVGVGALANPFAASSGADALLLARYQGFDKSEGLIAKEIVASALLAALTGSYVVPAKNGARVELSLIDGTTGDVLWSNTGVGPTSTYSLLLNATAKLPNASKAAAATSATTTATPNATQKTAATSEGAAQPAAASK